MSDVEHGIQVGPVMVYSARRKDVSAFYTDIVGLSGDAAGSSGDGAGAAVWLSAANAKVVVNEPASRDAPPEVRGQPGFVVWFGVADVHTAHEKARRAGCLVGDFYGDYFFAKDPDGRFVGIYASEDHHHDHED